MVDGSLKTIKNYCRKLLSNKLSSKLSFHNLEHTELVVNGATKIGIEEGLNAKECEIIIIAAWFHDTGFIESYNNHELASSMIAKDKLKELGYPKKVINEVISCIISTSVDSDLNNHLQEVLHDADSIHLSLDNYWKWNERLKKEIRYFENNNLRADQWYFQNLQFLKNHQYFTSYGQNVLEPLKQLHLSTNIKKLEDLYIHVK